MKFLAALTPKSEPCIYRLSFKYEKMNASGTRVGTFAYLCAEGTSEVVGAVVVNDSRDRFCKETGRKLAIAKLLAKMYFPEGSSEAIPMFGKQFRTQVWNTYHARNYRSPYPELPGF